MKPRITLLTLGVDDLERAVAFYRDGMGLKTDGIIGKEFEYGAVAFFELESGMKLGLWPRRSLAHDTGLPVRAQARAAGAVIVKAAGDTFYGGYAGYFHDPDQHLWEVAWNPQWTVPD